MCINFETYLDLRQERYRLDAFPVTYCHELLIVDAQTIFGDHRMVVEELLVETLHLNCH